MPELPEVETIVTDLNKKIVGDSIVDFWTEWKKALKNISVENFKKEIVGKKIIKAWRIGKNIFIDLSGGKTIYIHLKMTGHLLVKAKNQKTKTDYFSDRVNQYIRHRWTLEAKNKEEKILEFSDLRKFGKIVLLDTREVKTYQDIKSLGVDAMSVEFSFEKFQEILVKKKKTAIGLVLMDQNLIAGIGNIYRSEILFESGIDPQRPSGQLSSEEKKEIYQNIKKVLKKAIKYRGTSDSDYRDTAGAPGGFQKVMKVYNREKQNCQRCGTIIKRLKLGQRSVFICPACQK